MDNFILSGIKSHAYGPLYNQFKFFLFQAHDLAWGGGKDGLRKKDYGKAY